MSNDTSLTMDAAFRYANALFSLAKETNSVEKYEKDLDKVLEPVKADENLAGFVKSPLHSRKTQISVMESIGKKLNLSKEVNNTILLMASKRRLFALASMITHFKELCRKHRNEIIVEVSSAYELTNSLREKMKKTISSNIDREVVIKENCDPTLLGGLVVKIGSRMIDTSLRTRIVKLKSNLREVG